MAENLSSFGVYIAVTVAGCSAGDKEKKVAKLEKYREQLCEHVCAAKRSVESIFNTAQGRSVVSSGTLFAEVVMTCLYHASPVLESQLPRFAHFWFPSAHVCLGVSTGDAHTKADHTYTLLHVPPQENAEEGCPIKYAVSTGTVFHFYLNDIKEGHIQIPMNQLVSVLSIAFCLKHLQQTSEEGNFLFSIAVYCKNKQIHEFGSSTLYRNLEYWTERDKVGILNSLLLDKELEPQGAPRPKRGIESPEDLENTKMKKIDECP